ncbi:MAG: SDR family oxidoreductase [Bdellovibrionota bacterium]
MDRREHGEQEVSLTRALVIGSSGQVAAAFRESLQTRGVDFLSSSSHAAAGALPLNLADPASIHAFFKAAGDEPAEVFLAGALTHVDRCEDERELCHAMNAEGPALIAAECRSRGHKLTFFSTEYVFGNAEYEGGAVGPFSETDPPAPSSYYGACKWEAEKRIQETLGGEALIVRTTMVFSWAPQGNNFLMQYIRQLSDIAGGGSPPVFRIPEDQISTPTYAPFLAEATLALRGEGANGVFNIVGSDLLSRRELVERVIAEFGFDRAKSLGGFRFLKTADLGQKARRPLTGGLKMAKAESFGVKAMALTEAFARIRALRGG